MSIFSTSRPRWIGLAIIIALLFGLLLLLAPSKRADQEGSTYSRAPSGYGAWYAHMRQRGTPIQRWQKPLTALAESASPLTLLQVNRSQSRIEPQLQAWVEQGNTLVILGQLQPVTAAKFESYLPSPYGLVTIATRRRNPSVPVQLLGDRSGAVVWQEAMGKGKVIVCITPFLAANAYQDGQGNFEFLARLVTQSGHGVWVDEYLHGYKDSTVVESELGSSHWLAYLGHTPILGVLVQGLILLLVAIWAGNQRLGAAIALPNPQVNNSEVYIDALAAILEKAEHQDLLRKAIADNHKQSLLTQLGLDPTADREAICTRWQEQTGQSAQSVRSLWQKGDKLKPLTPSELKEWLQKWEEVAEISHK